jgi:hypothetical protein
VTTPSGDVALGLVHSHDVTYSFHRSVLGVMLHDLEHDRRLLHDIAVKCGSGGLVEARNQTAAAFLSGPAEWLWVVDTDMGFAPDTLDRLLAAADPVERPIVGALCFAWIEGEQDGMGGWLCGTRPTIFQFGEVAGEKTFAAVSEYPPDQLVRCAATGSACILIHRGVLEAITEGHGPTWYDRIATGAGRLLGEDISFCARAGSVGAAVHVHTGVHTNHQKTVWVSHHQHPPAQAEGFLVGESGPELFEVPTR